MDKIWEIPIYEDRLTATGVNTLPNFSLTWPEYTGNSTWPTNYYWTTPVNVYLYQIFCPKPKCKTANWLELNKEKECTTCGSLLRAVSRKIDYEIEVE